MRIQKATRQYEEWLSRYTALQPDGIRKKHEAMFGDTFPFLRATYYRWAQRWPLVCPELAGSPTVLSVGDLHVENFGTWRDAEGRLAWGINDFDEAYPLPYPNDLVRLAVSADLAIRAGHLCVKCVDACAAILEGYTETLSSGGSDGDGGGGAPFVLAETHDWLRGVAHGALLDPVSFWRKMNAFQVVTGAPPPESAIAALERALPGGAVVPYVVRKRTAGLGSLGHPRFLALQVYEGGYVAREAKALVPSAAAWAASLTAREKGGSRTDAAAGGPAEIYYQAILDRAVRCHDPFIRLSGHWIVRRLAPDCSRIELTSLPAERDEARLLRDMGRETANVHLGSLATPERRKAVRQDLARRKPGWLNAAATAMTRDTLADWEAWRKG